MFDRFAPHTYFWTIPQVKVKKLFIFFRRVQQTQSHTKIKREKTKNQPLTNAWMLWKAIKPSIVSRLKWQEGGKKALIEHTMIYQDQTKIASGWTEPKVKSSEWVKVEQISMLNRFKADLNHNLLRFISTLVYFLPLLFNLNQPTNQPKAESHIWKSFFTLFKCLCQSSLLMARN